MRRRALVLAAGFFLDMVLGDPHSFPHPVRWLGTFISRREKSLRGRYPKTKSKELAAGVILAAETLAVTLAGALGVLKLAGSVSGSLGLMLETVMCYQMLAARSLVDESMKVYEALAAGDTGKAKEALSMIVGRDVENLSEEGIIKAAVETVAENASDGVIAPLFYMALGGAPLMFLYKAVNTMDSMVGYQNETYLYFGRAAAKLDDLANLIPSRIAGLLMVVCAKGVGLDSKGAWRIFRRDRYAHKSPNSAQTEAACAGALGVELAGNASYFGKICRKPTIGDRIRPVENQDIPRANRLMYASAGLMAALCWGILWVWF
ncbi:MAG: cobalamin biosynthesis protein CobD [Hungatella sp.]|nr:cobalamin biosynthesis protein CobD [Hungatella sp.]MCI9635422.1 cobalamin biosynthesis protein CobD [Hungatella sp.]